MFRYTLWLYIFILIASSCGTKNSTLPPEPSITFSRTARTQILEFDSTTITIEFEDGDGDLGLTPGLLSSCTNNICDLTSDSSCLNDPAWTAFLLDQRDNCLRLKKIPYFEPSGKSPEVRGSMDINTGPIFCKCFPVGSCDKDTLVYEIFIKDRAGNFSNRVLSDPIIIECN